ncbi:MAG: MurR/RpiR family transcriptional regulator [Deltaproteobacteria bacterium]|nr:MurR/RpiR family transcriptional regulator [Candidatus Tharpella sp.]
MEQKNLIERIRSLPKLTPSEVKIADFLARHYPEIVFENATTISQKTGVSKATVVRFIARLGYDSFAKFQQQLRNDLVVRRELPVSRYTLIKKQDSGKAEDILALSLNAIMKNLQEFHAQIESDTFMNIARLLIETPGALHISGQRSSYALAHLFHGLMRRLRQQTFLLGGDLSSIPDALIDVQAQDTLFAIFRYPYAKITYKVAKYFASQKARIILLTDSNFSPLYDTVDHQLVVPVDESSLFHRFTAATAILESLTVAALHFCDDDIYKRFNLNEKLFTEFQTYCPGKVIDSLQVRKFMKKRKGEEK